jgi:YVTN family beta-propeller protein
VQAPAVRLLSESLDMNMGALPYLATRVGPGIWRVSGVYAPMNGRWGLTVQAQRNAVWSSVRQFIYSVPLSGPMRLLTPQAGPSGSSGAPPSQPANRSAALNVAFARSLPYTVFVTEMGSNGVRQLTGPLLHTGVQAHGVDGIDGAPYLLVTNFGAEPGTVSEIDIRTMRVTRTFKVGLGPAHIAFSPDHGRAYVTNFRSGDLSVIEMATGRTETVTFPDQGCFEPHGLDISEDGRTLYVACGGGAWIYTVDAHTLKVGRAVITAPGAFGVAVDTPRREVWVTNQTSNNVSVISQDSLKVVATIPVGKGPALLVASPNGGTVYVANQLGNTVSMIDTATRRVKATIPVASEPHGPDVTPDGRYLYVASIGGNAVTIIRTSDNRVVAVVPSANGSNEVAVKR